MKAQAIATDKGRIVYLDTVVTNCHDMTLFRKSRRILSDARCILADSGYQGLDKLYDQAFTPRKASKHHPLTDEDKGYNQQLASRRIAVEHVFAKVKTFRIFSSTYRNRKKRFNLRMNLIAGIVNFELEW